MCGVFGYISKDGKGPNLRTLKHIARVTETRGRDAFGFAWLDDQGRLRSYKQTGRISDHLGLLAMARNARLLIGHCRWATQGDPADNLNNHPHPADSGWIVHNGSLPDHRAIAKRYRLRGSTDCDSELLGLLIERAQGSLLDRSIDAVDKARRQNHRPLVLLGLWSRPGRLVVIREGNPLHVGKTAHGHYLASLSAYLPGKVSRILDSSARCYTINNTNPTIYDTRSQHNAQENAQEQESEIDYTQTGPAAASLFG